MDTKRIPHTHTNKRNQILLYHTHEKNGEKNLGSKTKQNKNHSITQTHRHRIKKSYLLKVEILNNLIFA